MGLKKRMKVGMRRAEGKLYHDSKTNEEVILNFKPKVVILYWVFTTLIFIDDEESHFAKPVTVGSNQSPTITDFAITDTGFQMVCKYSRGEIKWVAIA